MRAATAGGYGSTMDAHPFPEPAGPRHRLLPSPSVLFGTVLLAVTVLLIASAWNTRAMNRCAATPPGQESSPDYPAWRHDGFALEGRTCVYDDGAERLRLPLWP